MDCFISVLYFNCMTPANLSSSTLLLELPSFPCSSCQERVRQEDGFSLGVFLTHTVLVLSSCAPLQKTREGFANHHLAVMELVLHFKLLPVPWKLITLYQLAQKDCVLKRVWLLSHLPLLRAGLESTIPNKRRCQSTRR